jgi:hypothetical protein
MTSIQTGNQTKLEWLRSAVHEGIDDIERGNYTALRSNEELEEFVHEIHAELSGAFNPPGGS